MKPVAIISLVVASSVCVGMFQQSRFVGLEREAAELSQEISNPSSEKAELRARSLPMDVRSSARFPTGESLADLEARVVDVCEGIARDMEGLPMTAADRAADKESRTRLLESIAGLDPARALKLIQQLRSESNHPQALPEKPAQIVVDMLMDVNPKLLLDVLPALDNYPDAEDLKISALFVWLHKSPIAAVKWYDEQLGKGKWQEGADNGISNVIIEDAGLDPARALSRVLAYEASGDTDLFKNMGMHIAETIEEADGNRAFFSALCRETEKNPDSAALADIRQNYVATLGGLLNQWPFESALPLIDTGFTSAEKTTLARAIFYGNLDEPEKWATWMSRIPSTAADEQPAEVFFSSWFGADPAAAGKWLEGVPAGELKDHLREKHTEKPDMPSKER